MSASVTVETARVYRANGRRYLTKRSAWRALARAAIKGRCDCEFQEGDDWGSGYSCEYHRDQERYRRLVARLARFMERCSSRSPRTEEET